MTNDQTQMNNQVPMPKELVIGYSLVLGVLALEIPAGWRTPRRAHAATSLRFSFVRHWLGSFP
jgi:hypothetical protein